MSVSFEQLKSMVVFAQVVEQGSFSAAANKICISHAAVGQQMRRLEETLQVVLFDRSQPLLSINYAI